MIYSFYESFLGRLLLAARDEKLAGLYFADQPHAPAVGGLGALEDEADIFVETARQLEEYAAGQRNDFDLPLDLRGTPFQVRVWSEISGIPFGETISYQELALRIDSPLASQAVGAAVGANPVCWIVPCHRVVGKNGALTGYAGGLERKRRLLELEKRPAVLSCSAR